MFVRLENIGYITPTHFFAHTKFENAPKRDLNTILKTHFSIKMIRKKNFILYTEKKFGDVPNAHAKYKKLSHGKCSKEVIHGLIPSCGRGQGRRVKAVQAGLGWPRLVKAELSGWVKSKVDGHEPNWTVQKG